MLSEYVYVGCDDLLYDLNLIGKHVSHHYSTILRRRMLWRVLDSCFLSSGW